MPNVCIFAQLESLAIEECEQPLVEHQAAQRQEIVCRNQIGVTGAGWNDSCARMAIKGSIRIDHDRSTQTVFAHAAS